jgi:hypothetical protein
MHLYISLVNSVNVFSSDTMLYFCLCIKLTDNNKAIFVHPHTSCSNLFDGFRLNFVLEVNYNGVWLQPADQGVSNYS